MLVRTSTLAVILAALIISVVFTGEADGAGLVWRAINKASSSIYDLADVAGGCTNNQSQKYQTSNSTWICATLSGITSINSDTTAAQLINGVAGNTTASTSSGTTTVNLGSNVLMTGNSAQSTSAFKPLTLQGQNNIDFANTGLAIRNPLSTFATTIAGGAVTANRTLNTPVITGTDTMATLGLAQTFTGANTMSGQNVITTSTGGLIIRNPLSTFAATLKAGSNTGNTTVTLPITTSTLQTLNTPETVTGAKTMNAQNVISLSNTGLIVRNPASTFATTIAGGVNTANTTLTLPITTSTIISGGVLSANVTNNTPGIGRYTVVFTIALTANSGNIISGVIDATSNTNNVAPQIAMNTTNISSKGYCIYGTPVTVNTINYDFTRVNGTTTNAQDTGETTWLPLITATQSAPITFECAITSGPTAGNAKLWIHTSAAGTVTAKAGSYYIKTP